MERILWLIWKWWKRRKGDFAPVTKVFEVEDFTDPDNINERDRVVVCDTVEKQPSKVPSDSELRKLFRNLQLERNVNRLVIHWTATPHSATVSGILRFWREELGWNNPGYHLIADKDGLWTLLADFNDVTNGVRGYNRSSVHVAVIAGPDHVPTPAQYDFLELVIRLWREQFPMTSVKGHDELIPAYHCPGFSVDEFLKERGLWG